MPTRAFSTVRAGGWRGVHTQSWWDIGSEVVDEANTCSFLSPSSLYLGPQIRCPLREEDSHDATVVTVEC